MSKNYNYHRNQNSSSSIDNNTSVISWMKKNYDQLGQNNWQSYNINNQNILRPLAKEVPLRLKVQEQENARKILNQLGLVQKVDRTGNKVLQNFVPIKTKITKKQMTSLVNRLALSKMSK